MNRVLIPIILMLGIIFLLMIQCTVIDRWYPWGVRLELLPALLLYASFTVNLPSALLLGLLAGVMYDSFSAGHFGGSLFPYVASITLFCMVRPIFFRNQFTTQFLSGIVFGFMALSLQFLLSGKFMVGWEYAFPKILRLALVTGVLSVFYFAFFDVLARMIGLDPGRIEDSLT